MNRCVITGTPTHTHLRTRRLMNSSPIWVRIAHICHPRHLFLFQLFIYLCREHNGETADEPAGSRSITDPRPHLTGGEHPRYPSICLRSLSGGYGNRVPHPTLTCSAGNIFRIEGVERAEKKDRQEDSSGKTGRGKKGVC